MPLKLLVVIKDRLVASGEPRVAMKERRRPSAFKFQAKTLAGEHKVTVTKMR
ncbi:hypothetical protein D3C71_2161620 [compost metagenome]